MKTKRLIREPSSESEKGILCRAFPQRPTPTFKAHRFTDGERLIILRYVDDLELRQSVEKQLSKIEQSQKFAKAVAFGNNQEFSEGDKQMHDIIADCCRR